MTAKRRFEPARAKEIMTPADVAELLQVHLKTVYKLAAEGQLPGHRIGRSWRFSRAEVLKIFEPNKTNVLPKS